MWWEIGEIKWEVDKRMKSVWKRTKTMMKARERKHEKRRDSVCMIGNRIKFDKNKT